MSLSNTCLEQRLKEQEALKKFLIYCFVSSAAFHAGLIGVSATMIFDRAVKFTEEPIEILVVEDTNSQLEPEPNVKKDISNPEPKQVENSILQAPGAAEPGELTAPEPATEKATSPAEAVAEPTGLVSPSQQTEQPRSTVPDTPPDLTASPAQPPTVEAPPPEPAPPEPTVQPVTSEPTLEAVPTQTAAETAPTVASRAYSDRQRSQRQQQKSPHT
ncbi:MAG: hypothetical protein HC786_32885, partial [Richelia sp. CSU_2_1]|nr:hypothetical protein [Richelia sp. CSU_2_1]